MKFQKPHWDTISNEAKDFISKLLVADPKKRMGYEGIMVHPWITGNGINKTPIPEIRSKLKDLNLKRFKKVGVFV